MDQSCWLRVLILLSMYLMVNANIADHGKSLMFTLKQMDQTVNQAFSEEKIRVLTSYIFNSDSFHNILKINFNGKITAAQLYKDKKFFKQLQSQVYKYCRQWPKMKNDAELLRAVKAFVDYWPKRDMSLTMYDPVRVGIERVYRGGYYFQCFMIFIKNAHVTKQLTFITDKFIKKLESLTWLDKILFNRIEIAKEHIFHYNNERRFMEDLFDAIDMGIFNEPIKNYYLWRANAMEDDGIFAKIEYYIQDTLLRQTDYQLRI
ncbi:uncharacterized protein LOC111064509 isoform X2 [Nilaparvata lugens]|uniref:uncharacterized protein LOC111064509 isoform X2 n=1 Tax=Nilaparvata lugens TaxID=108931 RepID=UPI00193E79BC|nr:uncharacterized protein LOC111064509 isoform X2 [Nilaparvata lugens]